MTYSGANQARQARETLGRALSALQQEGIPEDVMNIASNIAQAVGALFEAERASSELDGKACVKNALGTIGQTVALLQDVPEQHKARVDPATEVLAGAMSILYPLTTVATVPPGSGMQTPAAVQQAAAAIPQAAPVAHVQAAPVAHTAPQPAPVAQQPAPVAQQPAPAAQPAPAPRPSAPSTGPRAQLEANIGATTESNFFVGFSGEIAEGGVFLATYEVLDRNERVELLVTLPGGYEFKTNGWVRFVRDPFDFGSEAHPGMGIQFETLDPKDRELVLRFIRKRAPTFYDD